MALLLFLECLFGEGFGLLFTALRTNSFSQLSIKLFSVCGLVNKSVKTILCNSNKFIKSQKIVKSEKNGPVYTMVTIKLETSHCLEVKPGLKTR